MLSGIVKTISSSAASPSASLPDAHYAGITFLGEPAPYRIASTRHIERSMPVDDEDDELHRPLTGDYADIFGWLCSERGLQWSRYRPSVLRRRERSCLQAVGARTLKDVKRLASANPARVDEGLNAVLIGVTSFFRDTTPFEALASELGRHERARQGAPLGILSLACSDGAELFSTGIVLGQLGLLPHAELLGIDCRVSAIERACRGVYALEAVESMDASVRESWFEFVGAGVRPIAALRSRTRWCVADAFALDEPGLADVILCRNLAIYLQHEAAEQLWRSIADRMHPGGLLMVGKAERPSRGLGFVRVGPCLYRKGESNP